MSLQAALDAIDKKFGEGTIIRYGDGPRSKPEVTPTGIPSLDKNLLGIGGVPRGRLIEVYGPEGSGKTTFTLHVLAEAQKLGHKVAFIDAEHALDPVYAQNLGVQMDDVYLTQPDSGEQALEIAEALVRSEEIAVIVIDSVAALTPRSEIDGEMGDAQVGVLARLMSQACRKLTGIMAKTQTTVIFINQLRDKIGVTWGNPETTPGGKALKFYASMRLDVRRIGAIKDGEEVVGSKTRIKTVKNKLYPPYKEIEIELIHGEGFSKESDLLDLAVAENVITKKGAWFSFEDKNFAQGRDNARKALKDEDFYNRVKDSIGERAKGAAS